MKKRMKKIIVLLMAAALAVPGQSLAGAAKMAVVNAQEQETKAVELQSEYFNMASSYEKVVYSKADHGFYLVKKGDPFYSNQQKFEVSDLHLKYPSQNDRHPQNNCPLRPGFLFYK